MFKEKLLEKKCLIRTWETKIFDWEISNQILVNGVWRVRERLSTAPIEFEAKNQLILPYNLTNLIVHHYHSKEIGHIGVNVVLSALRKKNSELLTERPQLEVSCQDVFNVNVTELWKANNLWPSFQKLELHLTNHHLAWWVWTILALCKLGKEKELWRDMGVFLPAWQAKQFI